MAEQDDYGVLTDTPFALGATQFGAGQGLAGAPLPAANLGALSARPAPALAMSDARRAVLNHIAGGEAKSYNELWGGGSFSSYADHPRQRFMTPAGTRTSSAGLYQFQQGTWDQQAKKLGLNDFSPANQDAAAWDLANTTYKQKTGRSLEADSAAGKVNWGALSGQWSSLVGQGTGPATGKPVNGGWGTSTTAMGGAVPPTSWTPSSAPVPRLSSDGLSPQHMLLAAAMPHVKITPIDYDPFKVMPPAQGPV